MAVIKSLNAEFGKMLTETPEIIALNVEDIVNGKIAFLSNKIILVNIHDQFTGVISGAHLQSSTEDTSSLKVGDMVESMVIGDDKETGLIVLSLKKASQVKLIGKLHSNFNTKEVITVIPNEANKGGLLIDLDGMKGFIPVSQLTPMNYPRVEGADPEKILEHLQRLVGKPFRVRVINVDNDGKKIIFSEKAAIEEQRMNALEGLKPGDNVEGVVSGILTYGLFVTFNGLEGLVHVSEIDWGHVSDPSKFAKVGDKMKVQVIGIDGDKISLSVKRLKANPWDELAKKFHVGDIVNVPVARISKFGIFVTLDGGISGLIHLSEIPEDLLKDLETSIRIGDPIEAKIITFEPNEKRIGLSIKALKEVASAPVEEKKEKKAEKKEEVAPAPVAEVAVEAVAEATPEVAAEPKKKVAKTKDAE